MADDAPPPTTAELLALLPDDYFRRALSHPVRLRVLVETERRPLCAREIGLMVGHTIQAMNWHIAGLAEFGLVRAVGGRRRRAFVECLWRASYPGWGRLAQMIEGVSAEGQAALRLERIAAARARERAVLRATGPAPASAGRSSRRGGATRRKS